jgi:hypothetical protein
MPETASSVIAAWSNFYVMTGSSASALTGLMFVVITLVTGVDRSKRTSEGIGTFSTPTVVHFCAALLISAVLSAPWRSLAPVSTSLGLAGLCGIVYVGRLMNRARRQLTYTPDLEDWVCYTILPFVAYGAILAGAIALLAAPADALFAFAGAALLLIFIGIHNAWDIVTFLAIGGHEALSSSSRTGDQTKDP